MIHEMQESGVSRRTFVKGSAIAGLALAGGSSMFACSPAGEEQGDAEGGAEAAAGETTVWSHCHVNCGGACPLRLHVVDDEIAWVDNDTSGSSEFGAYQLRPCSRTLFRRRRYMHCLQWPIPLLSSTQD